MSTYPPDVWRQLRGKTVQEIVKALEKDGYELEISRGATQAYRHPSKPGARRVVLHIHPKGEKGPHTIKYLLNQIDWTVEDMVRLKLIKGKAFRKK